MSAPADRFGAYLGPGEPVVAVSTGTLSETSSWIPASIALTDRRLLCATDDGRVVTVGYDTICTIRSRPRTARSYGGIDHRVILGCGSLVALLGGIGVVAFATSVLVPLLALVTAGSAIAAEGLRRQTDEFRPETVADVVKHALYDVDLVTADGLRRRANRIRRGTVPDVTKHAPYDVDGGALRQWTHDAVPVAAEERQLFLIGSSAVAVISFVALALLASSGYVVLGVLMLVGGIALIDYAYRNENDIDGIEISRRHEVEVSISTTADRAIRIRSDRSEGFVNELNRAAFADDVEFDSLVAPPS